MWETGTQNRFPAGTGFELWSGLGKTGTGTGFRWEPVLRWRMVSSKPVPRWELVLSWGVVWGKPEPEPVPGGNRF